MNSLMIHLSSVVILAVAVALICRAGRLRPALCHGLWLLVLVKLMLPPLIVWPLPMASVTSLERVMMPTAAPVQAESAPVSGVRSVSALPSDGAANWVQANEAAPGRWHPEQTYTLLIGVWALGALAAVLRTTLRYYQSRQRLREVTASLPADLHSMLAECAASLNIPPPKALVCESLGNVCIFAAGRPVLLVGSDLIPALSEAQWRAVFTHELAHLKRRDHWVAWLLLIAGAVWWWNPVLWWARRRIHEYSEMACDAWAVCRYPEAKRSYADAMVHIMALLAKREGAMPLLALGAWSVHMQERRLWMIMKTHVSPGLSRPLQAGLLLSALLISPAWMARGVAESSLSPASSEDNAPAWQLDLTPTGAASKQLEYSVSLEFEDIHLSELTGFINETLELDIVLDQRVVAPEGFDPAVDANPGYVTDGRIPNLGLVDIPLRDVLTAALRPLNLSFEVLGDSVWVSTPAQFAADALAPLPQAKVADTPLMRQLSIECGEIEFDDAHIAEFIAFLSDNFELPIVLDSRVVVPEGGDPTKPPLGSTGYVTDGKIRRIFARDKTILELIYMTIRPLGLTYEVEESYVFISSPDYIYSDSGA